MRYLATTSSLFYLFLTPTLVVCLPAILIRLIVIFSRITVPHFRSSTYSMLSPSSSSSSTPRTALHIQSSSHRYTIPLPPSHQLLVIDVGYLKVFVICSAYYPRRRKSSLAMMILLHMPQLSKNSIQLSHGGPCNYNFCDTIVSEVGFQ